MNVIKKMINKIKYKHPWDCYYKKDERTIEVPKKSELNLFWHDFMSRGRNYVGKVNYRELEKENKK